MKKKIIGEKIYIFDELPSTMDTSKEMIQRGIEEGTVIMAKYQTKGRGSNNREWVSNGDDALFSIILDTDPSKVNLLPIITAYSILVTLKNQTRKKINIKWPNDVLIDGKKISGVLIENLIVGKFSKTIVGVGININSSHKDSKNFIYPSISLKEIINKKTNVLEILENFIKNFNVFYKKLLIEEIDLGIINKNLYGLGKKIEFRTNYVEKQNKTISNIYKIISLNYDGTLKVSNLHGEYLDLSSSEITTNLNWL